MKAVAFVGIALEIGIDPSVRHAADLGFAPIIVSDACRFGHKVAADRSLEALRFSGDTVIIDQATFLAELVYTGKDCAEYDGGASRVTRQELDVMGVSAQARCRVYCRTKSQSTSSI